MCFKGNYSSFQFHSLKCQIFLLKTVIIFKNHRSYIIVVLFGLCFSFWISLYSAPYKSYFKWHFSLDLRFENQTWDQHSIMLEVRGRSYHALCHVWNSCSYIPMSEATSSFVREAWGRKEGGNSVSWMTHDPVSGSMGEWQNSPEQCSQGGQPYFMGSDYFCFF